jgi:hypothetical protein
MPPLNDYSTLKEYVAESCGARGRVHAGLRDRLVTIGVEEFPVDMGCDARGLEVLQARMRRRVKEEYGSILAILIISVIANLVARAIWQWWIDRRANRAIMMVWQADARKS